MSDSKEEAVMQEKEGDNEKGEEYTFNVDPKIEKLDGQTLKKVVDSCRVCEENSWNEIVPNSISNMCYLYGTPHKCHLICDQENLKAALAMIIEKRINTDIKVKIQGQIFDCHLAVLQVSTEFFKQFKTPHLIVIHEPEVTKLGFKKAYKWMSKQELALEHEGLIDLYVTARFLKMPHLLNQLWYCFECADFVKEGEAFKLYLQSIPFKTFTLQSLLLNRVNRFFLSAVATVEFLNLKVGNVCDILETDSIGVNSEMEIFFSAFRWLMCDWQNRKAHIEKLMKSIRFNLMPAWYIISLKAIQSPPELRELLEYPAVKATLNAALSYSVTQHFMVENSPLQQPLNMQKTQQREWTMDETAAHHHLYKCANWVYMDYNLFNTYLENIIKAGAQYYQTLKPLKPSNFQPCCLAVIENCRTVPEGPFY